LRLTPPRLRVNLPPLSAAWLRLARCLLPHRLQPARLGASLRVCPLPI
jgi:hypothetical protein